MKQRPTHKYVSVVNGATVTQILDDKNRLVSATSVKQDGDRTIIEHFDSKWRQTGSEIVTVNGNQTRTEHYNKKWKLEGVDIVTVTGNKTVTEHFDSDLDFQWAKAEFDYGQYDYVQLYNYKWQIAADYTINEVNHDVSGLHVNWAAVAAGVAHGFDLI
ncbi:hypothetical protein [Enterovirga aerilata]|uniref:Uncharacterized protein n=1 Tax=Enterovirga aerilata TaxID=2730920 RepID=A0A849I1P4_9HYPH|nr:hypothetical protein [Enterovirga sp. DB1703]NNM71281.1 hypothetical protein [Enterovirga sp. DB1703]